MRTLIEKLELEKDLWDEVYIACDLDGQEIRVMIDDAINDCIDIVKQHQAESDWISVDERLPDIGQRVLAQKRGYVTVCSMYRRGQGKLRWDDGRRLSDFEQYTHWMPLPKPPSEVQL